MKSSLLARETDQKSLKAYKLLNAQYPNSHTELTFESPFQLLVAVILSAQCTDARVNQVTPLLFQSYPTANKMKKANPKDIEKLIHSCGFFRMKTKSLLRMSKNLVDRFNGEVPKTMEELTQLAGVGRKTASVILNQAFDLPAIAVDTHVARVSNRLGWANHKNPEKIETALKALFPESLWGTINGMLILHGRRVCKARRPLCDTCCVSSHCRYFKNLLRLSPNA